MLSHSLIINKIEKFFDLNSNRSINDEELEEIIYIINKMQVKDSLKQTDMECRIKKIIVDRFQAFFNYKESGKFLEAENEIEKAKLEIGSLVD